MSDYGILLNLLRYFSQEQTGYVYTECDISGGRWRVQVPLKPNSCNIDKPEKPERGTACCKFSVVPRLYPRPKLFKQFFHTFCFVESLDVQVSVTRSLMQLDQILSCTLEFTKMSLAPDPL